MNFNVTTDNLCSLHGHGLELLVNVVPFVLVDFRGVLLDNHGRALSSLGFLVLRQKFA